MEGTESSSSVRQVISSVKVAATRPAWRVLKEIISSSAVASRDSCSDSTRMEGTESGITCLCLQRLISRCSDSTRMEGTESRLPGPGAGCSCSVAATRPAWRVLKDERREIAVGGGQWLHRLDPHGGY